MKPELTQAEKDLIEREFAARQDDDERRRRHLRFAFVLGLSAIVLRLFAVFAFRSPFLVGTLGAVWFGSVVYYTGALLLPRSFMQDMVPFGGMSRWQETCGALIKDGRGVRGIILISAPWLMRIVILILAYSGIALHGALKQ
jgi:hypothetical protein